MAVVKKCVLCYMQMTRVSSLCWDFIIMELIWVICIWYSSSSVIFRLRNIGQIILIFQPGASVKYYCAWQTGVKAFVHLAHTWTRVGLLIESGATNTKLLQNNPHNFQLSALKTSQYVIQRHAVHIMRSVVTLSYAHSTLIQFMNHPPL